MPPTKKEVPLPALIADAISKLPLRVGLASKDLFSGDYFAHNENEVFPQASAIKIPILWHLETKANAKELALDERVPIDPQNGAGGCGNLQHFSHKGSHLCLADLAFLMIVQSDNVATNHLIDRLTVEAINLQLANLGLAQTRLRRRMMDFTAKESGQENTSTPKEALQLMTQLHSLAQDLDPIAQAVLSKLRLQKESPYTAGLPTTAVVENKPGMLDGLRTEWALVSEAQGTQRTTAYGVTLMIQSSHPEKTIADNSKIKQAMYELGSLIHQHWTSQQS